jgi:sugar-phosphatase
MTTQGDGLTGQRFRAVLFDLDGTLIDSVPAMERSWIRWSGEHGIDPMRLLGFHGVPATGVIAALLPESSAEEQAAAFRRIEDLEVADTEGIVVLPGAAQALGALAGAGAHAAIVTSCTAPLAEARLTATQLPHPEVVVTADQTPRGKPHPDPWLRGAELLGVAPQECLVVEDAVSGLRAARAAGAGGRLAVTHTTAPDELAEHADLVVAGLDEVVFDVDPDGWVTVRKAQVG